MIFFLHNLATFPSSFAFSNLIWKMCVEMGSEGTEVSSGKVAAGSWSKEKGWKYQRLFLHHDNIRFHSFTEKVNVIRPAPTKEMAHQEIYMSMVTLNRQKLKSKDQPWISARILLCKIIPFRHKSIIKVSTLWPKIHSISSILCIQLWTMWSIYAQPEVNFFKFKKILSRQNKI